MGEAKEKDMAPAGISEARRRTVADREAALNISTYLNIKQLEKNPHDTCEEHLRTRIIKNEIQNDRKK